MIGKHLCLLFQLIFEAIPKSESDQARRYRGFIAVDSVQFKSGDECKGEIFFKLKIFSNKMSGQVTAPLTLVCASSPMTQRLTLIGKW